MYFYQIQEEMIRITIEKMIKIGNVEYLKPAFRTIPCFLRFEEQKMFFLQYLQLELESHVLHEASFKLNLLRAMKFMVICSNGSFSKQEHVSFTIYFLICHF